MKKISLVCLLLALVGCSASPQFIRGNYYMTGDSNCKLYREITATSINCYTSDDKLVGYRNAMTDQELQMYRHEQIMNKTEATNGGVLDFV